MRVRITIVAMGALLAATACDSGADLDDALSTEDVAALREIAETDAEIVLGRDWARLTARFAADAVRMPPNSAAIVGRDAIREFVEATPPILAFDFQMLSLEGNGELAYMRAAWSFTLAPPDAAEVSDSGKILIVFRKQADGRWLTVADAWNSDLPSRFPSLSL